MLLSSSMLRGISVTLFGTLFFTSAHSWAQGKGETSNSSPPETTQTEPKDVLTSEARLRFAEGVEAYDLKQYEVAQAAFLQAWALKPHPVVLLNLAQSELMSQQYAKAAEHFEQYLASGEKESQEDAANGLREAQAFVGKLLITGGTGQLYVDGALIGPLPRATALYLPAGGHEIYSSETPTQQIVLTAGKESKFAFPGAIASSDSIRLLPENDLSKLPEPDLAAAAIAPVNPSAQAYHEREDFFDWYAHKPFAWASSGIGLIGLVGVGVGIGMQASYYNQAKDQSYAINDQFQSDYNSGYISGGTTCSPVASSSAPDGLVQGYTDACASLDASRSSAEDSATLAYVSGGVALAGILGTVLYYTIDSRVENASSNDEKPPTDAIRWQLSPSFSPTGGGLFASGSF